MNEIEKRIHRGMSQLAPDVFQNILADNSPKLESEVWLMEEEHKTSRDFWMRAARTAAVLAACCVLILGLAVCRMSLKVDSVVEIDVNPSLELQVNRSDRVVRLNALNADGVKILDDTRESLKHAKLEKAIQTLVNTMVRDGFINEEKNSVLVSVDHSRDAAKSAELQQLVADNVKEALSEDQITGVVYYQSYSMDSTVTQIADKYGISPGKAAFIQRLLLKRPELSIEELAKLSISEITELLENENVDVSEYVAENRRTPKPEYKKKAPAEPEMDERLLAKAEDSTEFGEVNWVNKHEPCREDENRDETIQIPEKNEILPEDGVIIENETAGGIQQGSGTQGGGQVGEPENPDSGLTAGGTPEEPGQEGDKPDDEGQPGTDDSLVEDTGNSGQMGNGNSGEDGSQWEDVKDIPMVLRTQLIALTQSVDGLLAQLQKIGSLEEEGANKELFDNCSASFIQVKAQYDSVHKQSCEMYTSGALDERSHETALKIFKLAEVKLILSEKKLLEFAPVYGEI